MISITINGRRIRARKNETVLEVARRSGITIPTLCFHEDLTPFGGCRLCIVEVKGKKTPLTACTLNAEDGMVVKTDTPRLRKLRKFTLELILSEHPNACLICERESDCRDFQECIKKSAVTFGCKSCPQNDNCELQDLVRELKVKEIPFEFRYRNLDVERYDPFFDRDYNLCILCGRCIRACEEIRHAHTLEFHHRGPETLVGTAFDLPHLESGCQFCGACVDVCPTGALRDRFGRYDKPPERSVKTTCILCSMGCAINLNVSDNKITCSTPSKTQICVRGRFGIAPLVNHPKRSTKPLLRKEDHIVEVDWQEALEFVAEKLRAHKGRTGIVYSPHLTSEAIDKLYSIADFAKAKVATQKSNDATPKPLKLKGIKGRPVFIIVNTDMIADFPVLLMKLRTKFEKRASFITIDAVCRGREFADITLNPKPGAELDLIESLIDSKKVSKKSGIPLADIEHVKKMIHGRKIYVLYNTDNFHIAKSGKSFTPLPLHSPINSLKIARIGYDGSPEIMDSTNFECLYTIGAAPLPRRKYKTVIVQDCFLPDSDFDVFLPAATFAEINGRVIDIEGKCKRVRKAIDPLGKSMSDEDIIAEIAQAMHVKLKRPMRRRPAKGRPRARRIDRKKNSLRLIMRENTHVFRNRPLSQIMKGFALLCHDQNIWMNEKTAKKHKLREGMRAVIISRYSTPQMPVKISASVPDDAVLIFKHPSMIIDENAPVRLECTKS
jgi:NADH dehydrogenase/NADH:ubiquinone oxidoreductase subunit G